ncbi:MAG: helix-turn-helix transcriptional regulator [Bacilli bacterium]|nr:helix-turn-helix transcriptional regulator [Bacilli bacterium]
MDNEKIAEFIKKIRTDNNLTQKDLADKYSVTYQAVSKWENAKNIPDLSLLIQMANDYNVDLSNILNIDIKNNKKDNKLKYIYIIIGLILIVGIIIFIIFNNNSSFELKTIKSTCSDFEVFGSVAYDSKKSSIYIANINYCGKEDSNIYQKLTCSLYEKNNNTITEISVCDSKNDITLEEYLKNIKFNIDDYEKKCKTYGDDTLYLEINAYNEDNFTKTYKIPLSVDKNC